MFEVERKLFFMENHDCIIMEQFKFKASMVYQGKDFLFDRPAQIDAFL